MASYPNSVRTWTTKVDNIDIVYAAHMNDVQDEVRAVQLELGTNPRGTAADVKTRIANLETGKSDTTHTHPTINLSTVTTKGDLIVGTGSAAVSRLGVGADGTFLQAASGQTTGLQWANVDHAQTLNLTTGNPHTQYARLAGDTFTGQVNVNGYGLRPYLAANKAATDAASTYPLGLSEIQLTAGTANGWPVDQGVVVTAREANGHTAQTIFEQGSTSQWLRTSNADGTWADAQNIFNVPEQAGPYRTSTYSIASATDTYIPFETVSVPYSPHGALWNSGTPTRVTAQIRGEYHVTAQIRLQGGTTGTERYMAIAGGASRDQKRWAQQSAQLASGAPAVALNCVATMKLEAGEFLEMLVYHQGGTGVSSTAEFTYSTFMNVQLLYRL